jgi:hypothetical protein
MVLNEKGRTEARNSRVFVVRTRTIDCDEVMIVGEFVVAKGWVNPGK